MSVLRFKLTMNGDRTAVSLKVGSESADGPFLFENPEGSRISKVLNDFSGGIASFDDVREIGTYLFSGLLQGDVEKLFDKARAEIEQANTTGGEEQCVIRLVVPPELQQLPWESFYDESHRGFLLNHRQYTLIREAERVEATPRVGQGKLPLSMLVVVPDGSRLKVESELHQLAVVVDKLGANIEYVELAERVTSSKLGEKLRQRHWDIVHFIGHGDLIKGKAHIRLNTDGDEDNWMYGEQFAMLFDEKAPRLVVLNCCYGGREAATPTLSGVGPFLLRAGIPAVVAMQYAIRDVVASHFSETFYTELLTGERPGRIDLALARARKRLCIDHAGLAFATPVLYLAEDRASLFEAGASAAAAAAAAAPSVAVVSPAVPEPPVPSGPALPKDLIEALVDRRCVPVIGADFLSLGATRAGPLSLRPRDLAVHLATEAGCLPLIERDVKGTDETDDEDLLPRVCQLFEKRNERYKLLLAVQRAYKDLQPPPLADTVASWDVPGMVCLYFDGLIHAAMSRRGVGPRSIMAPEENLNGFKGEPLLLHLRGHYVDPDSLVLTERDHDQLHDRLGRISPAIADVLVRKQIGMTALYLGVSPQNRLLRRLTNVLRSPRNRPGSCGPIYFVCRESDDIDEAYWRDYDVEWLRFEPIALVSALSNALVKARQ
jgi:hypothetical protein